MKTSKASLINQRRILEKRLKTWQPVRDEQVPQSGWLQAIRGSLGITSRQMADLLGISQANVIALEKREAEGKATLESVERAARAMGCRLVYGVVPASPYETLDAILDAKARALAANLLSRVEHSMQLEKQGTDASDSKEVMSRLADDLKSKLDKRLWQTKSAKKGRAP